MNCLDVLIDDSERLACSAQEKAACLETVGKLARLWYQIRQDGLLVVLTLAEGENDPFFRTCLLRMSGGPIQNT